MIFGYKLTERDGKCMKVNKTALDGVFILEPMVFGDNRGWFMESWSKRTMEESGLFYDFIQDNHSYSSVKGTIRGLHFQKQFSQSKLVRCIRGAVFDVAVDLRKGSKTFGRYFGVVLDAEKQNQFYIPEGFAHGFLVLTEEATFAYKCTDFYHPEDEGGLMWNDPAIGIDWKSVAGDVEPLLSEKDTKHPAFDSNNNYFDINGKWTK